MRRASWRAPARNARDRRLSRRGQSGGDARRRLRHPGGLLCDQHRPGSRSAVPRRARRPSICCCRSVSGRSSRPGLEEKIRIVLSGLRGEDSIAELCRREGIVENLYYRWSKEFLEAGKKRLAGDTAWAATSDEVKELRREASALKEVVAELMLENRLLKKSMIGAGEDGA